MENNQRIKLTGCVQQSIQDINRSLDPKDITMQTGYSIEVFAKWFDAPSSLAFTPEGDILIGESGYISGNPRVLRLSEGRIDVFADNFAAPLSGVTYKDGDVYIAHRGNITVIKSNGTRQEIVAGLPTAGDHWNSNVCFCAEGKMYFALGTATNSGVVGEDNTWMKDQPYFHDNVGSYIMLNGQNFESVSVKGEVTYTGAFSPYGVTNLPHELRKGIERAAGSILRSNPDGTELELVAWGFRYPSFLKFDRNNRLFVSNQGYDIRGSRPIANAPDEFHRVFPGIWYGWPDYAGGEPVTLPKFKPEGKVQPEFLISSHPNTPPIPFAIFPGKPYIVGFDFNNNHEFGYYGDAFIAEFGGGGRITGEGATPYYGRGHRISTINMHNGTISTFAINKSGFASSITGEGGLCRPVFVEFGPDGALYVVDFGTNAPLNLSEYYPNTGVIWRITKD